MGPEQGPRHRLPKPLIPQGYYQWPMRLRVARVQPSQEARSAASPPHLLCSRALRLQLTDHIEFHKATQPSTGRHHTTRLTEGAPNPSAPPLTALPPDNFVGPWQYNLVRMAALLCTLGKLLTSLNFGVLVYKIRGESGWSRGESSWREAGSMGPGISRCSNKD